MTPTISGGGSSSSSSINGKNRDVEQTSYFMNLVEFSKSMSSLRIGLSIVARARHRSVSRPNDRCAHEHTHTHTHERI